MVVRRLDAMRRCGDVLAQKGFADPSGIGGGIPVPMSTLSDEYHDAPTEPKDSDRVPEPEPPSLARRVVEWLRRHPKT